MTALAAMLSLRLGFCIRATRPNTPAAAGTTQAIKAIRNVSIPTKLVDFNMTSIRHVCVAARRRHTKSVAAAASRFAQTVMTLALLFGLRGMNDVSVRG